MQLFLQEEYAPPGLNPYLHLIPAVQEFNELPVSKEHQRYLDQQRNIKKLNGTWKPKRKKLAEKGTRSCYKKGCKHPECAKANRDYQREYMRLWREGIHMIDITDVS